MHGLMANIYAVSRSPRAKLGYRLSRGLASHEFHREKIMWSHEHQEHRGFRCLTKLNNPTDCPVLTRFNTPDLSYRGMWEPSADHVGKIAGGATVRYVMPDHIVKETRPQKQYGK